MDFRSSDAAKKLQGGSCGITTLIDRSTGKIIVGGQGDCNVFGIYEKKGDAENSETTYTIKQPILEHTVKNEACLKASVS
jgi:hypothetical protein